MALYSRLRTSTAASFRPRHFSILSSDSHLKPRAALSSDSHLNPRAALSLLKSEENPDRILEICRVASLSPFSNLGRISLSVAISKLSEANQFQSIDAYLQELRSRPDLQNARFASHCLILYGQANMLNRALTVFDEFHNKGLCRSTKSLNALLVAGLIAKDHDQVKRIFMEFPQRYEIKPDLETYNNAIKSFCESGSSSSVYSILVDMQKKGVKPNANTFGTLLAGFYEEEKYEDVGKVLNLMKEHDIPVGVTTYNIRIQSLCKLKMSNEAKTLLIGMLSKGIKPNSDTYNHLIHGFCKEGNLEEAKSLFNSMVVDRGLEPDCNCYFNMVHFLCQGGEFEVALRICNECMGKKWVPKFGTMKLLVNGLASISKVEEAKELMKNVKKLFLKNADMWDEIEKGLLPPVEKVTWVS